MIGDKCHLPLISLLDADVVVSLSKVDNGEEFCLLYFDDQL